MTNIIANTEKNAADIMAAFLEKYFEICPPINGPRMTPAPYEKPSLPNATARSVKIFRTNC
jgi:hypothetical protein